MIAGCVTFGGVMEALAVVVAIALALVVVAAAVAGVVDGVRQDIKDIKRERDL